VHKQKTKEHTMKIILRIILILLVAAVIAEGFYLAVNNSSIASSGAEGSQPLAMTNADGQTFQPMDRPDRDEGGASLAGLSGVLVTIAKIAGITLLVSLIQKAFDMLKRRKPSFAN
jgi:hypothetical protein